MEMLASLDTDTWLLVIAVTAGWFDPFGSNVPAVQLDTNDNTHTRHIYALCYIDCNSVVFPI